MTHVPDPDFYKDPFNGHGVLLRNHATRRIWGLPMPCGGMVVRTTEWTGPLLEQNKRRRDVNSGQRWGDGKIVASIPPALYYHGDMAKAIANDDEKWVARWINDSDHAKFRTKEGNV